MKKRHYALLAIFSAGLAIFSAGVVFAQEQADTTIKIRVEEKQEEERGARPTIPVERKGKTPKTETTIKAQELEIRSGAGASNVFKAIELTPSLNVQTDDAYGLGGGSIRLRGFDDRQIGVTIDGMPLNDSGNFALYPHEYADVENLESITVERGAVSKRSPFYVEVGGAIRIRTKPPKNRASIEIFPKFGTNNFERYFVRLDSGLIGKTGFKSFISYSHTTADKWKGPGKHPEYRDHTTIGLSWNLGRLFAEFYFDNNSQLNYFYKGLTYSEVQQLDKNARKDYNPVLMPSASASENVNYYKFYKNPYDNQQWRANIELNITDSIKFAIKPYYWKGRGSGTSATFSGSNIFYRESYNYTDRPGFTAELDFKLPYNSELSVGYWYERSDLKQWQPSFPVIVNSDGSFNLVTNPSASPRFQYNYIQRTITTTNSIFSFYEIKDLMGRLDLNLGFRIARVKRDFKTLTTNPNSTSSTVTGVPYYPEDGVYDDPRLVRNQRLSYAKTYNKFLPNFGMGVKIVDGLYGYFAYAKNFRVPPNFLGTIPSSVTAQFVANQLKPEEADSFDIGLRYDTDKFYIVPSLYYVNYKNRLIRVADPTDPNLIYLRNVGKVKAYGFELEVGANPFSFLSLYTSFSYNQAKFKEDFVENVYVKDKNVPDTPKHMIKAGAHIRVYGFNIYPSVQYIDSRYGTLDNRQKVEGYTLVNLSVNRRFFRNYTAYLDIVNLLDKRYVGRISVGNTNATYYVGAPFTISAGLKATF